MFIAIGAFIVLGLIKGLTSKWGDLTTALSNMWGGIVDWWNKMMDRDNPGRSIVLMIVDTLVSAVGFLVSGIQWLIELIVDIFTTLNPLDAIGKAWNSLFDNTSDSVEGSIENTGNKIANSFSEMWNKIKNIFIILIMIQVKQIKRQHLLQHIMQQIISSFRIKS